MNFKFIVSLKNTIKNFYVIFVTRAGPRYFDVQENFVSKFAHKKKILIIKKIF